MQERFVALALSSPQAQSTWPGAPRWRSDRSHPHGPSLDGMTLRALIPPGFPRTHSAHHDHVLGMSLELRWASTAWRMAPHGRRIEREALEEIDRRDAVFNTFRPDSEFSRRMATPERDIEVSSDLARILEWAAWWQARTLGAFDPACAEWGPALQAAQATGLPRFPIRAED